MTDIERARAVMEAATHGRRWTHAADYGEIREGWGVVAENASINAGRAICLAVNVLPAMLDLIETARWHLEDGSPGSSRVFTEALAAAEAALRAEVER